MDPLPPPKFGYHLWMFMYLVFSILVLNIFKPKKAPKFFYESDAIQTVWLDGEDMYDLVWKFTLQMILAAMAWRYKYVDYTEKQKI